MTHQLLVHLLLLLHLLAGHSDLVVQRLDLTQLPGRLHLDGDQTGSTQRSEVRVSGTELTDLHF